MSGSWFSNHCRLHRKSIWDTEESQVNSYQNRKIHGHMALQSCVWHRFTGELKSQKKPENQPNPCYVPEWPSGINIPRGHKQPD